MTLTLRRVFVGLWLIALSLAVLALSGHPADSKSKVATFDTINAKRINIVEPHGKYRLVIANRENFPGNFMAGKEYKRPGGHRAGGMLFFNDAGDEVGGLTFGNQTSSKGYSASSGLLFDQYKQDQTVGVIYSEHNARRTAGLQVWDRPDYSIKPLLEMNDHAARAKTSKARKAIRGRMRAYAKAHGGGGAKRMFVGKQNGATIVRLADKQGRPRLVLEVAGNGQASIEFLDQNGKVVQRISGNRKASSH